MTAPLVVLSGPTGSGKTTAARALADCLDLECWTAQNDQSTDGSPTCGWRSWLAPDSDPQKVGLAELDRISAMELLLRLPRAGRPVVVESAALPLLMPPDNAALMVRLTASFRVRTDRLRAALPDLAQPEASRIVDRKDVATRAVVRTSWAMDADAVRACEWRSDLVVQCPDMIRCADPKECEAITIDLIAAAYRVYEHYLAAGPMAPATDAVRHLRELLREHPQRVRRCTPLLTDPADRFSVWSWQRRLLLELDDEEDEREVAS